MLVSPHSSSDKRYDALCSRLMMRCDLAVIVTDTLLMNSGLFLRSISFGIRSFLCHCKVVERHKAPSGLLHHTQAEVACTALSMVPISLLGLSSRLPWCHIVIILDTARTHFAAPLEAGGRGRAFLITLLPCTLMEIGSRLPIECMYMRRIKDATR
jgi:hypothetical protein